MHTHIYIQVFCMVSWKGTENTGNLEEDALKQDESLGGEGDCRETQDRNPEKKMYQHRPSLWKQAKGAHLTIIQTKVQG